MSTTSTSLLNLLGIKADLAYATRQQIYWSDKYETVAKMVRKQTTYEEQWNRAYEKCFDLEADKTLEVDGRTFYGNCECDAVDYADLKVEEYDENLLGYLTEEELSFELYQTNWEAETERLKALLDPAKTEVSSAAQDTGLIN